MTLAPAPVDVPAAHLLGWDCIEWWVGNARSFAGFLMSAFKGPIEAEIKRVLDERFG